jgi:hypothetical protein
MASEVVTVDAASAAILASPKPDADLVRTAAEGERLEVLGVNGAWYHVRSGDDEGWIAAASIAAGSAAGGPGSGSDESTGLEQAGQLRERFIPWE